MKSMHLLPLLAALASPAWAQSPPALPVPPRPPSPPETLQPPRAPELTQAVRPPLVAPPVGVVVMVEGFDVTGVTRLLPAEVQAVLKPFTGRRLAYAELAAAADAVTTLYRRRGYLLALAYLPEQVVRDGRIEIAVLEGRLGRLNVPAAPGLDGGFLAAMAGWGLPPGTVVDEPTLLRNLLVLNQQSGLAVGADIRPGAEVGTADLTLDVRETLPRLAASAALDSHGTRATGRVRLGAALFLRQWLGRGDQFNLQAQASEAGGQQSAQAGYSLPVHASGTRLGVSLAHVEYKVVDPALRALGANGRATEVQASVEQPLLRRLDYGVALRAAYTHKWLRDRVDSLLERDDRHLDSLQLALRGDWREGRGNGPRAQGFYSLAVTGGRVRFDDATAAAADAVLRGTAGDYGRVNLDIGREQPFGERVTLLTRLALQGALDKNLDNAERSVLGGAHAQRAYGDLATSADESATFSADLRWRAPTPWPLTLSAFGDWARGRTDHQPGAASGSNRLRAHLVGLGADMQLPLDLTLRVAATRQALRDATGERRATRGWIELIKAF